MNYQNLIVHLIVLFTAIPIHEAAHAYVADKLGDPTGRYSGRMTLNPLAHFDLMGSIALIFFGIGWAKPVPINPRNFKDQKKGMAVSAAAGPISNLLVATVSLVAAKLVMYIGYMTGYGYVTTTLYGIFTYMTLVNISLAVFNLIPIPPFDGSRIFNYFLPDRYYFKIMQYERYIFIGLLVLLYTGILNIPMGILQGALFGALDKLTMIVDVIGKIIVF